MPREPTTTSASTPPDAAALRARFDAAAPLTVGLEEEVMVLDAATGDLSPVAASIVAADHEGVLKGELPAAQLEIVTPPARTVAEAAVALLAARRHAAALAGPGVALAGAGLHPTAAVEGELSAAPRYALTREEYGPVARRQLVFGLHVHVAVGGADRALAVYNAMRGHLPDIAALAANAPFHDGRDTGLASARPQISGMLPRQGVPPAMESWEELAATLRWGYRAGSLPTPSRWWWELRLHPALGTLEVRVADTQATVAEAAAVAAAVHALVAWLAGHHDAGESLPSPATWRIGENRWSAMRHGLDGTMADLLTGEPVPTRERLAELLDTLAPVAAGLGCARELECARRLARRNGAMRQREVAERDGIGAVAPWLAARFPLRAPEVMAKSPGVARSL